ncbi:helix-turn-helix domain-containing protein [Smaragdicoccus niigatensis]|uniref:helix-turn-helix domain-containing protein n=1 Tax=Smaragdicoccus niigatensis TaxID=359359 RepID=UPI000475B371|nr:helix-turn-helix domain-containing protein [Smaragdicoccus niigatensis]
MTAGPLLRQWRERRRMSQLELATSAGVSVRHVSFVETGRSQPSRALLLKLGEHLDIPLRERNSLLLAGGFAPVFHESELPVSVISDAIRKILDAQLPYPAIVVDRHWNMVDANAAVAAFTVGCAGFLLEPPVNVLRLSLHPEGFAPRIANLGQWRAHVLERLARQVAASGDAELAALETELSEYPGSSDEVPDTNPLVVPLVLKDGASFFTTTTVFGTPLDITLAELAIESFFPADEETAARYR